MMARHARKKLPCESQKDNLFNQSTLATSCNDSTKATTLTMIKNTTTTTTTFSNVL